VGRLDGRRGRRRGDYGGRRRQRRRGRCRLELGDAFLERSDACVVTRLERVDLGAQLADRRRPLVSATTRAAITMNAEEDEPSHGVPPD
jgi:hypothetical protein